MYNINVDKDYLPGCERGRENESVRDGYIVYNNAQ